MNEWFEANIGSGGVMAVLRGYGPEAAASTALRLWDAGVRCVEVPIQTPGAVESLRAVVKVARSHPLMVGAGTVTSTVRLVTAAEAGAVFTVAPGFNEAVVHASLEKRIPHLPGVATATEIESALARGFGWLKAFPASVLGPGWFKAMRGPFPEASFVATGGVSTNQGELYLMAGARAFALGDSLKHEAELEHLAQYMRDRGTP